MVGCNDPVVVLVRRVAGLCSNDGGISSNNFMIARLAMVIVLSAIFGLLAFCFVKT